jgi:hypothetical protein
LPLVLSKMMGQRQDVGSIRQPTNKSSSRVADNLANLWQQMPAYVGNCGIGDATQ